MKSLAEKEQLENDRLIEVLNRAFHTQIISKTAEHMDFDDEINDFNASGKQNLTFEKMKSRFEVISELDKLGNLNDV